MWFLRYLGEYILLKYTAPLYFFVAKDNHTLASQLNSALQDMIADGTFTTMFFNDSQVKMVLAKANLATRKVMPLQNPSLSSRTPLLQHALWFDPLNESNTQ